MYLYFFFSYFSSPSIYHSERLERSWKINRILCVCFHLLLTHIFQCRCHSTGIRKNYSIITALLQRIAGAVVSLRYTQHTPDILFRSNAVSDNIYIVLFRFWLLIGHNRPYTNTHTHTHIWHGIWSVWCNNGMEMKKERCVWLFAGIVGTWFLVCIGVIWCRSNFRNGPAEY